MSNRGGRRPPPFSLSVESFPESARPVTLHPRPDAGRSRDRSRQERRRSRHPDAQAILVMGCCRSALAGVDVVIVGRRRAAPPDASLLLIWPVRRTQCRKTCDVSRRTRERCGAFDCSCSSFAAAGAGFGSLVRRGVKASASLLPARMLRVLTSISPAPQDGLCWNTAHLNLL